MRYPYILYDRAVEHRPIFAGLAGRPYIADLSPESTLFQNIDMRDQRGFQRILEEQMQEEYTWGVADYLENRATLLADCPQMVSEKRFIHLGLDIIVALGTPLHAPLDSVVEETGYESGEGNYGSYVLLRHESPRFAIFYSFYGHLRYASLPRPGAIIAAGRPFAEIGDFHENGNWFYHTHVQILTQKGFDRGYISKGYCSAAELAEMDGLCPSPIPLFKVF
ncbi:MAG: peptidoglycan DD-metalloendopeptidase family protein [Desulfopila sp.]